MYGGGHDAAGWNMEEAMTPARQTVKPDTILHEISELWNKMTKPAPGEAPEEYSSGSLRACAMTLIVFVNDEDDPRALDSTLEAVTRAHPNRTIVVRLKDDSGTLTSRTSARCWMPVGHHREVCCEEIELTVSMDRLNDIPGIVGPLAAPDVPRVVGFRAPRLENAPDIGNLLALGDKIIVDSERPGAPTFADMRVLSHAGYIVADLAWTRLTKLRELLAQLLEVRGLSGITNVAIDYDGAEPAPGARYLQAWLRSGLPDAVIDLHRTGHTGNGKVKAVRIDPDFNVSVQSNCAEYDTGSLRQRANFPGCADQDLIREELSIMRRDPVFDLALQRMSIWIPQS
jgi:glucose-6-phosphate dehydrogenase assembly protein OpcA